MSKEAIIVCESNCLSRGSLISLLKEIARAHPEFKFRNATNEEEIQLVKKYGGLFKPFTVIGEDVFFGVPDKHKVVQLIC